MCVCVCGGGRGGGWKKISRRCRFVIQRDIKERSGCCFHVRASGECAFVWKCVTHTKELRAAWPSWCCCHADMEPSESPGELKPCRDEISALLRENSAKKDDRATHCERSHFSCRVDIAEGNGGQQRKEWRRGCTHQRGCRWWACLSTPGPVGVSWEWWQTLLVWPEAGWIGSCLSSGCSAKHTEQHNENRTRRALLTNLKLKKFKIKFRCICKFVVLHF